MVFHDRESKHDFVKTVPGKWQTLCVFCKTSLSHYTGFTVLNYRKTSNISRTLVGNKIVDNSDVVGASPVGAAPTTSSFLT